MLSGVTKTGSRYFHNLILTDSFPQFEILQYRFFLSALCRFSICYFGSNSVCPTMFDWQAELVVPALVSTSMQTRIPATAVTSSQIIPTKSFAAVLSRRSSSTDDTPLPAPCIKGDSLSITIGRQNIRRE